jgi:hypothetical protein
MSDGQDFACSNLLELSAVLVHLRKVGAAKRPNGRVPPIVVDQEPKVVAGAAGSSC